MRAETAEKRAAERAAKTEDMYNQSAKSLRPLKLGTSVRVQNPITGRWDRVGVVVGIDQHRDYHVKLPSGRVCWRNRRYLRPASDAVPTVQAGEYPLRGSTRRHVTFQLPEDNVLRRNRRTRKSPDRLGYA